MLSYSSNQTRYTSEVQQWHHDVGPHIPIGDFVNYLDPEALGLENAAQFYAPVEFSIHVKGHISEPAGAIRLHVPVHANENWLSILKEHIGSMYNVGAQYIDLRDVAGRSVTVFDKDQLENVGKLSVYVDGRKARLDTMPEVPAEYSINKLNSIESWYNAVKADLPEIAAKELVKCDSVDELIEAIAPGGSVESVIKSELHERTSDWNEFVRVNRMNSPYSLSSAGAAQALDAIGETIRGELDAFVRSAPQQISSYFSSIQAERMQRKLYQEGRDVDGYKQLFNAMPAHIKVSSENGFQMFHDFASNVFDSPTVAEDITNVIYLKPIAGCRWETDPKTDFDDGRNQNHQKEMREKKSKSKTRGYSADIVKPVQPESRLKLFKRFKELYTGLSTAEKQRIRNVTHAISNTPLASVNAQNMYNLYVDEMRVSLDGSGFQRTESEISNNLIGLDFGFWGSKQKTLTLKDNYKDLVNVGKFYRINLKIPKGSNITKEQMRYLISMLAERLEFISTSDNPLLTTAYFGPDAVVTEGMKLVTPTDRTAAAPKQGSKEEKKFYQGNDNLKVLSTDDTVYASLKQNELVWKPYTNSAKFFAEEFGKIIDKPFTEKSVSAYSDLVSETLKNKSWFSYGKNYFGFSASNLKPLALIIFGYEYKNAENMTDAQVQEIFYKLMRQVHRAHKRSGVSVFQTALSKFEQREKREKKLARSAEKQQPKNIPSASKKTIPYFQRDKDARVKFKELLKVTRETDDKLTIIFEQNIAEGADVLRKHIEMILEDEKYNSKERYVYLELLSYLSGADLKQYVNFKETTEVLKQRDGVKNGYPSRLKDFLNDAIYYIYLDLEAENNAPVPSKTSATDPPLERSESFREKAKRWLADEKRHDPKFYRAFLELENAGPVKLLDAITNVLMGKYDKTTRLHYLNLLGYKAYVDIDKYVDTETLLKALKTKTGPTGDNKVKGLTRFIREAIDYLYLDQVLSGENDSSGYESTNESDATQDSSYSEEEEKDLTNAQTDHDSQSASTSDSSSAESSFSSEEEEEEEAPSDDENDSSDSVPGVGTINFNDIKKDVEKDNKFKGDEVEKRNLTDVVNYIKLRGVRAFKREISNASLEKLIKHLDLQVPKTGSGKKGTVIQKDLINVLRMAAGYKKIESNIGAHHPWNAHIQKLKDISGSYPDHYIENHNKMDLSEHAPYEGDAEETYEAYHMFAGAAVMPEAAFISRHRCMDKHKKKKKKSRERPPLVNASVAMQMRERPTLVSASVAMQMRERPPLVPIREEIRERPPLVPIREEIRERPPLVPIREEEIRERPPLVSASVAMQMRERPPLVSASVAMQMRERNVKVEKIESPSRFAGLPSVDDLF